MWSSQHGTWVIRLIADAYTVMQQSMDPHAVSIYYSSHPGIFHSVMTEAGHGYCQGMAACHSRPFCSASCSHMKHKAVHKLGKQLNRRASAAHPASSSPIHAYRSFGAQNGGRPGC